MRSTICGSWTNVEPRRKLRAAFPFLSSLSCSLSRSASSSLPLVSSLWRCVLLATACHALNGGRSDSILFWMLYATYIRQDEKQLLSTVWPSPPPIKNSAFAYTRVLFLKSLETSSLRFASLSRACCTRSSITNVRQPRIMSRMPTEPVVSWSMLITRWFMYSTRSCLTASTFLFRRSSVSLSSFWVAVAFRQYSKNMMYRSWSHGWIISIIFWAIPSLRAWLFLAALAALSSDSQACQITSSSTSRAFPAMPSRAVNSLGFIERLALFSLSLNFFSWRSSVASCSQAWKQRFWSARPPLGPHASRALSTAACPARKVTRSWHVRL
mmetsp:Transcript_23988/g.62564  ORF Transcript_23988/g.62564 Transcript_23988/m.62564 type:complete len:326 (-) Transcript_23988:181-1158(-)